MAEVVLDVDAPVEVALASLGATSVALDPPPPTRPIDVDWRDSPVSIALDQYVPMRPMDVGWYEGAYEVTPDGTTQTMPTSGLLMARDVTVGPIPSNYGRISYSGGILTVS